MPKENVVSFRLDEKKFEALKERRLKADKPVGDQVRESTRAQNCG
jgi:hypothetical protein